MSFGKKGVAKMNKVIIPTNKYSDNIFDKLESIYDRSLKNTNISTCVRCIDNLSGSIFEGTITTILGFTGSR